MGGGDGAVSSQAWLDACRELWAAQPERPGASARIQYVVVGGADDVHYYDVFVDGRVTESALGDLADPEVTLTLSHADGVAMVCGELDPNAAFADGWIAFAGDMRTLMGMFPIIWPSPRSRARTPARYRALRQEIREFTDFADR